MRRIVRAALSVSFGLAVAASVWAGDAAADHAKAQKDRDEAAKLNAQAYKDHEKAVADYDAAIALQLTADRDHAKARQLYWAAYLLDKQSRKEWVENAIKWEQGVIGHLKNQIKRHGEYAKHLEGLIQNEEKSVKDLQAAIKSETDPKNKAGEELALGSAEEEVKGYKEHLACDQGTLKNEENALKAREAQLKALEAELKKL